MSTYLVAGRCCPARRLLRGAACCGPTFRSLASPIDKPLLLCRGLGIVNLNYFDASKRNPPSLGHRQFSPRLSGPVSPLSSCRKTGKRRNADAHRGEQLYTEKRPHTCVSFLFADAWTRHSVTYFSSLTPAPTCVKQLQFPHPPNFRQRSNRRQPYRSSLFPLSTLTEAEGQPFHGAYWHQAPTPALHRRHLCLTWLVPSSSPTSSKRTHLSSRSRVAAQCAMVL